MVRDGVRAFNPAQPGCANCELNLDCLRGKEINAHTAHLDRRACAIDNNLIHFQYHATVCLTYDCTQQRITDHGQYGRSVSTSRAIRWYLEALQENSIIPYHVDTGALVKTFKDRGCIVNEGWIPCP
jgi:hypothetical protein